jgi:LytS/YehU family sensor histidine kinase
MNPHFIFNSLNSINRFILQNNKVQASEYLTKFSRLIRMILNSSTNPTVTLAEDVEALQLYLELERLRFEEKFSFKVECDPDIDTDFLQVPPMLLQPFVENAIWHGLMNKEGEGHLWININQEDSTLICTITDDGIGRKKAAELQDKSGKHKSMGMKITECRIAMMQKMNEENKSIEVRDLVDAEGSAAGTEVILKIPMMK